MKLVNKTDYCLKTLKFYFHIKKKNKLKKINKKKTNKLYIKKIKKKIKSWKKIIRIFKKIRILHFNRFRFWNKLQSIHKLYFFRKSTFYKWISKVKSHRKLYLWTASCNILYFHFLKKLKKLKLKKLKLKKLKYYKIIRRIRLWKRWGKYIYRLARISNIKFLNYDNLFVKRCIYRVRRWKKKKKLKAILPLFLNCLLYKRAYLGRLVRKKKLKKKKLKKCFYNYFKKKKLNINYLNIKHGKAVHNKNILNYIFMNDYSVKSFYINFYKQIKLNNTKPRVKKKTLKKKTYLFNIWKNRLTSYKKAREVHWQTFKKGTLKKRRYKNFLYFFLRNTKKYINNILLFFIVKFKLSYIFWTNFTKMYLYYFKKKLTYKSIYQLPISLLFWSYINLHLIKKKKIRKKIRKWIFVKIKTKRTFWMNRKKKIPKFFKKQTVINKQVDNCIQYDFITNYFFIVKNKHNSICNESVIFDNKLLKLHDFRYKA